MLKQIISYIIALFCVFLFFRFKKKIQKCRIRVSELLSCAGVWLPFIIIMLILPVYQAIDKSTRKYFKHEEYSGNAI